MRTLEQLIKRKKSAVKASFIAQGERDLIEAEISRHLQIEPEIEYTREGVQKRTVWYNRLHELQRALDLH